jgi:trans-feruloyl-CoA hydratase/vanillin synthase
MVNGWCFGGGYGPLFACDLAFAADEAQFGLSEINWGILPGGGATKVATELLPFRKRDVPRDDGRECRRQDRRRLGPGQRGAAARGPEGARDSEVAKVLLKKNPVALKATKDAVRRVKEMTYDDAEDYLIRAQEAANSYDNDGRKEGIKQFIDDKTTSRAWAPTIWPSRAETGLGRGGRKRERFSVCHAPMFDWEPF